MMVMMMVNGDDGDGNDDSDDDGDVDDYDGNGDEHSPPHPPPQPFAALSKTCGGPGKVSINPGSKRIRLAVVMKRSISWQVQMSP